MRKKRLRTSKKIAAAATGLLLLDVSCLPDNYLLNFFGAGRTVVLSAFAETVFGTIVDTLFPEANDNGNGNGTGTDTTGT
jgi:hypothetical protein